MRKNSGFILVSAALLLFVVYTYRNLINVYLQQDEWYSLGTEMAGGIFGLFRGTPVIYLLSGSQRFFGSLLNNIWYALFRSNTVPMAIFAVTVHCINILLWFKISLSVTNKRWVSVISAVFFGISVVSNQALSWFASIFTTLPSATFAFLSILSVITYTKNKRRGWLYAAQFLAICAYIFKESAVFIFFLLPVVYLLNNRKTRITVLLQKFSIVLLYAVFVIITRIYSILGIGPAATSFVTSSGNTWVKLSLHGLLYPVISLSQMFIPPQIMFKAASVFQSLFYGSVQGFTASQLGVETIVSDFLSFILSVTLCALLYLVGSKIKEVRLWIGFGLLFSVLSFLPFVVLNKGNAYLDSRYFYMGIAGGGLIAGSVLYACYIAVYKKFRKAAFITALLLTAIVILYIYKNSILIQRSIMQLAYESAERKNILSSVFRLRPVLPDNPVIYVYGNNYGYYGLPEVKVPFQQGFGYTLEVLYFDSGIIPKEFLLEPFLWGIRDQGYREIHGKGFGYFSSPDTLRSFILKNPDKAKSVVGFFYDAHTHTVTDISAEIRQQIQK